MATYKVIGSKQRNRRRDRRRHEPLLSLVLEGHRYETADYSLGGFRLGDYQGRRQLDDEVDVVLDGRVRGQAIRIETRIRVARLGPEPGEFGAEFIGFRAGSFETLEKLMINRV